MHSRQYSISTLHSLPIPSFIHSSTPPPPPSPCYLPSLPFCHSPRLVPSLLLPFSLTSHPLTHSLSLSLPKPLCENEASGAGFVLSTSPSSVLFPSPFPPPTFDCLPLRVSFVEGRIGVYAAPTTVQQNAPSPRAMK